MIILLDTSTSTCKLTLVGDDKVTHDEWLADRELAEKLLSYLEDKLQERSAALQDVTGLGFMKGPGSFTGLRIGASVLNTLADSLGVPIVGENGDDWQDQAIARLKAGEDDKLILPEYGRAANITTPRK